ncbi:MAG TPA: ATP-grasp domain-containing protein [Bacteriovoracaceae bacterium]|nr:ATP-grasp domain-containing protein [Bacteriovoracaceae bacterium]
MQHANKEVIGIIGDGQLALMLAEALIDRGIDFLSLSSSLDSCMMRNYPQFTTLDEKSFVYLCSTFTLENEFLSCQELTLLLKEKSPELFPELESYRHFQDKISQRTFFEGLGLPAPKWMALREDSDLPVALEEFSFPFILKSSQGGYDGKGVRVIDHREMFDETLKSFGFHQGQQLLLEEKIRISCELAQGFIQNRSGDCSFLPLVHTVQENNVCNLVLYPAEVAEDVKVKIQHILKTLADSGLVGIFNFEFFVDQQQNVYVNEGAPRPHNSQHLTIDASTHSQFDLLARYLAKDENLPAEVATRKSAMVNLLGVSTGSGYQLTLPPVQGPVSIRAKLYGKERSLPGRKMGHVTIVDERGDCNLRSIAKEITQGYYI